jgi:hypothetical protein
MPRDYKKEYANYQGKPDQIANRADRNSARRQMEKKGVVSKGDGLDVDHKAAEMAEVISAQSLSLQTVRLHEPVQQG